MTVPDPKVHGVILRAIDEIRLLRFRFGGKERIVEPHDYGIHQGVVRLFVYQVGGQSSSGPLPAWRLMDVAKMSEIEMLEQTFPGLGHHDRAGEAIEQSLIHLRFQLLNLLTERRLSDTFTSSRARKAAFFSDSNEVTELMNLHWKNLVVATVRPRL